MSYTVMNLHFCDLCNESIPQADLDQGRAVRRNERLICVACEGAMSGSHEPPAAASQRAAPPPPMVGVQTPGSSVAAVALAFSSVALVVGVGAGTYLFWRLEESNRVLQDDLAQLERLAPESARTVSAALVHEIGAREQELATARSEISDLSARLEELERSGDVGASLERRVDRIDRRLGGLDDLSSRVEHHSSVLERLAEETAELASVSARAPEPEPAAVPPLVAEATLEVTPEDAGGGSSAWQSWLGDLANADSGTRWQAVQSLGDTHDPEVVPHLVPMLADADIFVRMAACRHLGDLGSIDAIPALIDTLGDEEASVREAALVALRGLSGQSIPFDPLARDAERNKRIRAWREWWEGASKDLLGGDKRRSKS